MAIQKTETFLETLSGLRFRSPYIVTLKAAEVKAAANIARLLSLDEDQVNVQVNEEVIRQARKLLSDLQQKYYPLPALSYRAKISNENVFIFTYFAPSLLHLYGNNDMMVAGIALMSLVIMYSVFHSVIECGYTAKQQCGEFFKDGFQPAYQKSINFFDQKIKQISKEAIYPLFDRRQPRITVDVSHLLGVQLESFDSNQLLDLYKKIYSDLLQLCDAPKIKYE